MIQHVHPVQHIHELGIGVECVIRAAGIAHDAL